MARFRVIRWWGNNVGREGLGDGGAGRQAKGLPESPRHPYVHRNAGSLLQHRHPGAAPRWTYRPACSPSPPPPEREAQGAPTLDGLSEELRPLAPCISVGAGCVLGELLEKDVREGKMGKGQHGPQVRRGEEAGVSERQNNLEPHIRERKW